MHDEQKPQMQVSLSTPQQLDPEGKIAKAELYRAAKMSMKLFQLIQDGQQLESWVQAKITKSADYLDSVYHYLEYQVKFGQGGEASSVDDITGDMELSTPRRKSEEDDEVVESLTYDQQLQALLESAVKNAKKTKSKRQTTSESQLDEIDYNAYRKKASTQRAKAQIGAMLGRDPEQKAKDAATLKKRDRGLKMLYARDAKANAAASAKQQAADIAELPQLKAKYAQMKSKYEALGGNTWQYADRNQNLSAAEKEARKLEYAMVQLQTHIANIEKQQKRAVGESKKVRTPKNKG